MAPVCCFSKVQGGAGEKRCCKSDHKCCTDAHGGCCPPEWNCCYADKAKTQPQCCKPKDPPGVLEGAYGVHGGGKYVTGGGVVSLLRCDICGCSGPVTLSGSDINVQGSGLIVGGCDAYNFGSRTQIGSMDLGSFTATTMVSGDFTAMAVGTADVGGSLRTVALRLARSAGVESFAITDAATGAVLASGVGEGDRARTDVNILYA